GPGPAAFDSMQQGQRDDFAGIQFGLRVFRDLQHLLVHRVEQCDNKILGSHTPGSARLKSVQPQLELSRDYLSTRTLAITYQTNTLGYYWRSPDRPWLCAPPWALGAPLLLALRLLRGSRCSLTLANGKRSQGVKFTCC